MDPQKIYLVQTDTTVGLASQNETALRAAKERAQNKPFIVTVAGCKELKKLTRIPKKSRKIIRRAKKTTFVYPHKNIAVRVVHKGSYYDFLKPFGWMYSTSANISGGSFDMEFAKQVADVVVGESFFESTPSSIVILGKKPRRVR